MELDYKNKSRNVADEAEMNVADEDKTIES